MANNISFYSVFIALPLILVPFGIALGSDTDDELGLKIQSAAFKTNKGSLKVKGKLTDESDIPITMSLYDADIGTLLAQTDSVKKFRFEIDQFPGQFAPCRVRVDAGSLSAVKEVKSAPSNCSEFDGLSLGLRGVVRDDPIPFATVTITVGGITYTTVADENGEYFINISALNTGALVQIEAVDPANESTNLSSLAGSIAKLVEDANEDGIVDGTENPNINTTPFTTALFVLLGEANGGSVPSTQEELDAAQTSVDATELVVLAAVIKTIVDGGLPIPIDPDTGQPYTTILELLSDTSVDANGNTSLDNFVADNQTAVDQAATDILSDAGIIPGFNFDTLPDRYFAVATPQAGFLAETGVAFEFDGGATQPGTGFYAATGSASGGAIVVPTSRTFTYSIVDGRIEIDLDNPIVTTEFIVPSPEETLTCTVPEYQCSPNPSPAGCICVCTDIPFEEAGPLSLVTQELQSISLTRFAVSDGTEFVIQKDSRKRSYDEFQVDGTPVQICDEFGIESFNVQLRNSPTQPSISYDATLQAGKSVASALFYDVGETFFGDAPRSFTIDLLTFSGTQGSCPLGWNQLNAYIASQVPENAAFNLCWRVVQAGGETMVGPRQISRQGDIEIDYGDGWLQVVRRLEIMGPESSVFSDLWNLITEERFGALHTAVDVDPAFAFTPAFLVLPTDEYWQAIYAFWRKDAWPTDASGSFVNPSVFGWDLENDQTGLQWFSSCAFPNRPINPWQILAEDSMLGSARNYPAGALEMTYQGGGLRQRIWLPLAAVTSTAPEFVGGPIPRTRMYVLEEDLRNTKTLISPRINAQINISATLLPSDCP